MNICINCGKQTTNPKFCSRGCSAIHNNKAFPKRKVEGNCHICKIPISRSNKYCTKCRPSQSLDLTKITYGEMTTKRKYQKNSRIRNLARYLYRKSSREKYCVRCGYDKHYEVCHIKGVSSHDETCLLSEINNLENLIALCPNCHWELDKGLWKIEDIT